MLDLLAELPLLRFLFGAVTSSHDELWEKVRVLAKAKHVVLFDEARNPHPSSHALHQDGSVPSWRSLLRGFWCW